MKTRTDVVSKLIGLFATQSHVLLCKARPVMHMCHQLPRLMLMKQNFVKQRSGCIVWTCNFCSSFWIDSVFSDCWNKSLMLNRMPGAELDWWCGFGRRTPTCLYVGLATSVGPSLPGWLDESLETHPWGVDWRIASEEEHVVQPPAECAAKEWSHHWDL